MRAFERQAPDFEDEDAARNPARLDAIRSWLSTGMHSFSVDPRRRRGHHQRARQLLADDGRSGPTAPGEWHSLASALDRHTVRNGMSELSTVERRVITLAYLEGRTNREIAGILGISVSTVRRRLWVGLQRLEAYISRSGTWLSTFLLVAAAYVLYRPARVARSAAAAASSDWAHRLVSTVAVAATVSAVGLAAVSPDAIRPGKSPATASAPIRAIAAAPSLELSVPPDHVTNNGPMPVAPIVIPNVAPVVVTSVVRVIHTSEVPPLPEIVTLPKTHEKHGCGGKPTDAPPSVPVGRHSGGSPVSHPGKGGCHA